MLVCVHVITRKQVNHLYNSIYYNIYVSLVDIFVDILKTFCTYLHQHQFIDILQRYWIIFKLILIHIQIE